VLPSQKSPLPPVVPVGMTKEQIVESGLECWCVGLGLRDVVEGDTERWRCTRSWSVDFFPEIFCFRSFKFTYKMKCLEILFEVSNNLLYQRKNKGFHL